MEVDVSVEQFLTLEFDTVRHADITDVAALAGGMDCLHHRFLGTDALQDRIRADSFRQILDSSHALITALGHDVGSAEFTRDLLA